MTPVSVITRTKDRPVTLRRARASVESQNYGDLEWIIVNDGGEQPPVDDIADLAATNGIDVEVIHHDQSKGRWTAANAGLEHAGGDYVVLHDDDDSWAPTFLEQTTPLLDECGPDVAGVVVRSMEIRERIDGSSIDQVDRKPYNPVFSHPSLYGLAAGEYFLPPISVLYRRSVHETTGPYNDDLRIHADWEFYLRLLANFELEFIPEYLANYHLRSEESDARGYLNTVDDLDEHRRVRAQIRNRLLREDLERDRVGLGVIANIAGANEHLLYYPRAALRVLHRKRYRLKQWLSEVLD